MRPNRRRFLKAAALAAGPVAAACGETGLTPKTPPRAQGNGATFDPDGTAHITRVIPPPAMLSSEARRWLASLAGKGPGPKTLPERRAATDEWRARQASEAQRLFPVTLEEQVIGGVRTQVITPLETPPVNRSKVLVNLHGGGFNSDSGSLVEGIPIAHLAKMKVASVYYRLAPEHPFPAAVDDVVAVYRELLKSYRPTSIGVFGTSAGAYLTAQVAVRLRQSKLALPGALGIFSGGADYSRLTESNLMYTLDGLPGELELMDPNHPPADEYQGRTDPKDPVLSPLFADLNGWPPSLLVTSTRDLAMSDTAIFHRALLAAGNDARLVVFEALPHAFWYHYELPETREALGLMARFFEERVGK
jgi:monoterpene epsilon-lactone hydrolase